MSRKQQSSLPAIDTPYMIDFFTKSAQHSQPDRLFEPGDRAA